MTLISACGVVLSAAFFAGLFSSTRRPLLALIVTLGSAGPYFSALLYGAPLNFGGSPYDHRKSTTALVERAVLKLAPMGAMVQVALRARQITSSSSQGAANDPQYSKLIAVGLVLSSLGDLALEFNLDNPNGKLFIIGLGCFLAAHIVYIFAFYRQVGGWSASPRAGALLFAVATALFGVLLSGGRMKAALVAPVAVYAVVIAAMVWRAIVRAAAAAAGSTTVPGATAGPSAQSGALARAGAALFMVSDAVLALDKFYAPWADAKMVVMVTYYAAQAGIAWSVHGSACRSATGTRVVKKHQ